MPRAATDTLMVYFAGHGLRDRSERLYLALEDTDADHPQIGSLAYPMLRDVIRQVGHRSRYRLTILDCCYSGLAGSMNAITAPTRNDLAQVLGEPQSPENNRARGWDDYGDLVLTSAPPTRRSFVLPGGKAALDQHCRLAQCVARRLGRVGVSRRG
ncbi:hypothetical protein ACFWNK_03080 [Streptomyces sp. NPDC058417]|uniref:hypothetical protein n=1 Tax=unclassified Streptomyces TaxID=2593676 RepID=UPI003656ED51